MTDPGTLPSVGYADGLDPNGDGILTDAVWTNVPVVPDAPGAGGLGEGANQFSTPTVDDRGGVDVAYALEECNTSIDHGLRFKRSTTGGSTWPATRRTSTSGAVRRQPGPGGPTTEQARADPDLAVARV